MVLILYIHYAYPLKWNLNNSFFGIGITIDKGFDSSRGISWKAEMIKLQGRRSLRQTIGFSGRQLSYTCAWIVLSRHGQYLISGCWPRALCWRRSSMDWARSLLIIWFLILNLIRKELEIPDDLSIIIGIALGYSDAQHPQNKFRSLRRPIQEVVRFIGFYFKSAILFYTHQLKKMGKEFNLWVSLR